LFYSRIYLYLNYWLNKDIDDCDGIEGVEKKKLKKQQQREKKQQQQINKKANENKNKIN
jgi:hypothetical protein